MTAGVTGLEVANATVAFGGRAGLERVTLRVARGERLALLGPSGVGKTSLLRAIAGLGGLMGGTVVVDGRDVTALPPDQRGIVYLHQTPLLFPHLSVLDNVAFPIEVRGTSRDEARARARAFIARVRLEALAGRHPGTLSGGQRHRVALARALAAAPSVLLLDEPFSSLDPELRADVRAAVIELLVEPGSPAVVLVTHDVDEAAGLADRLAVMLDGRIAQSGAARDLLTRPGSLAVARFLGLANLLCGRRDDSGRVHCILGSFESSGPAGAVTVFVRPSALRAGREGHSSISGTIVEVIERVSGSTVRVTVDGERLDAVPEAAVPRERGRAVSLTVDASGVHVIPGVEEPPACSTTSCAG